MGCIQMYPGRNNYPLRAIKKGHLDVTRFYTYYTFRYIFKIKLNIKNLIVQKIFHTEILVLYLKKRRLAISNILTRIFPVNFVAFRVFFSGTDIILRIWNPFRLPSPVFQRCNESRNVTPTRAM